MCGLLGCCSARPVESGPATYRWPRRTVHTLAVTASRVNQERSMVKAMRRIGIAASNVHREIKDPADKIGRFLTDAFHLLALFAIGATTVWSAARAFVGMAAQGGA